MGNSVGGPGRTEARECQVVGSACRNVPHVVPPWSGWFSLRRGLQSAGDGMAICYCPHPTRVSANGLSVRGARRSVGSNGGFANGGRDAVGVFGAIPELFRPRGGHLSRS